MYNNWLDFGDRDLVESGVRRNVVHEAALCNLIKVYELFTDLDLDFLADLWDFLFECWLNNFRLNNNWLHDFWLNDNWFFDHFLGNLLLDNLWCNNWDWLLNNLDITPNLLTKSDVVTGLHSEVSSVPASLLRSLHSDFPNVILTRFDFTVNFNCLAIQEVSTCLNKNDISWP